MGTLTQKVVGAAQFNGTAGAGLFSFQTSDNLPATTRIAVSRIAYHAVSGGNVGSEVYFAWTNPSDPDGFILAGRALNAAMVAPDTSGDYVVCGGLVPRGLNDVHWQLQCYSVGKDVNATITIDWQIVPMPHSTERDSLR